VAKRRLEREADINHAIAILEQKLSEVGIESQIRGRPKHFFSIWKKMHDQGREFDEIYDLTAVPGDHQLRSGTATAPSASVHSLWKPVPGRFKDFIAMPKVNMYQSLHTTVIGPKGDPVEIQIRTWEMHRIAEEGIAAHWLYKEKKSGKDRIDDSLVWLRQLLENQQDTNDPAEFLGQRPRRSSSPTRSTSSRPRATSRRCRRLHADRLSPTPCTPRWASTRWAPR
jgi:GTP pyrophosphokinase